MSIRLYDPTAQPPSHAGELAPRLGDLRGSRPGILDNGKPNAGTLMRAVIDVLRTRFGAGEVSIGRMPIYEPPSPEVVDLLARCSFVVAGSAD